MKGQRRYLIKYTRLAIGDDPGATQVPKTGLLARRAARRNKVDELKGWHWKEVIDADTGWIMDTCVREVLDGRLRLFWARIFTTNPYRARRPKSW